jgi:hypothetical protein
MTIRIERMELERTLLSQLAITADLDREFRTQPALYASWGFLVARAEDKVRKLEERHDLVFSELYAKYRRSHADAKENDCKAYVRKAARYRAVQDALNRAKLERDIMKAGYRAFETKTSMLMGLGARARAELSAQDFLRATSTVTKSFRKRRPKRRS